MAKFCENCGAAADEGAKFCKGCGSNIGEIAGQARNDVSVGDAPLRVPPPQYAPQTQYQQPAYAPPPQGNKKMLIAIIASVAAVALIVAGIFLVPKFFGGGDDAPDTTPAIASTPAPTPEPTPEPDPKLVLNKIVFKRNDPNVDVNGQAAFLDEFGSAPFSIDDVLMLPLDSVYKLLGGSVEDDADTGYKSASFRGRVLKVKPGEATVEIDGEPATLNTAPIQRGGTTFVPAQAVADALGADLSVDIEAQTVTLEILLESAIDTVSLLPPRAPYPESPAFLSIGREFNKIGVAYDFKSVNSEGDEFVGSVTVTDVKVIDGDDYFLPKEGYEWLIFRYATQTTDERTYPGTGYVSYYYRFYGADYYSHDLKSKPYPISGEELAEVGTVNYYGIDYPIYNQDQLLVDEGGETWSSSEWEVGFLVPVGYDGIYVFFYNANNVDRLNWTSSDDPRQHEFLIGDVIDDDSLLFRAPAHLFALQPPSSAPNLAAFEGTYSGRYERETMADFNGNVSITISDVDADALTCTVQVDGDYDTSSAVYDITLFPGSSYGVDTDGSVLIRLNYYFPGYELMIEGDQLIGALPYDDGEAVFPLILSLTKTTAQSMVVVDADLEGIWINGSGDDIHLFEDIESIGFTIEPDRDGGGGEVLVDLEGTNYWEWWADWWLSPYGELCTDDYEWSLYNEFTCTITGNTLTLTDKDGGTRTYTRG